MHVGRISAVRPGGAVKEEAAVEWTSDRLPIRERIAKRIKVIESPRAVAIGIDGVFISVRVTTPALDKTLNFYATTTIMTGFCVPRVHTVFRARPARPRTGFGSCRIECKTTQQCRQKTKTHHCFPFTHVGILPGTLSGICHHSVKNLQSTFSNPPLTSIPILLAQRVKNVCGAQYNSLTRNMPVVYICSAGSRHSFAAGLTSCPMNSSGSYK